MATGERGGGGGGGGGGGEWVGSVLWGGDGEGWGGACMHIEAALVRKGRAVVTKGRHKVWAACKSV